MTDRSGVASESDVRAGQSQSDEADTFQYEVSAGKRFTFGRNWQRFLSVLDENRITEAERSLCQMLEVESLAGKSFLDVGSGSGLFSLAAVRLGASRVYSFDYDPDSVACTQHLRESFTSDAPNWTVDRGSVLDSAYLAQLGTWDVVYSWGVLHHTGDMWSALRNVASLVAPGGILFISIYNDEGLVSTFWSLIKRFHNLSRFSRRLTLAVFVPYFVLRGLAADIVLRENPLARYTQYKRLRGMSALYDIYDWLGGYPYEVAKPGEIFELYRKLGFSLQRLATVGRSHGCNEYVFRRV